MQPDDFMPRFGISRETLGALQTYHALLLKWQKAINLVSHQTLDHAWQRHFADSLQILSLLRDVPAGRTLADIGSGAGFPGLVVALARPDISVHLVESDERKAQFLRTVSRETHAHNVTTHAQRIEHIAPDLTPDFVTARALAALPDLLAYVRPWVIKNPALQCVFLKGKTAEEEIIAAQAQYSFSYNSIASITDSEATVLHITGVQLRT